MLAKLVDSRLKDWDDYVDTVSYFYNLQPHSLTGSAPFDLFYARRANGLIDYNVDPKDTIEKHVPIYTYNPEDIERHYQEIQEVIRPAIASRQRKLREAAKARFDKKHKLVEYQVGSLVAIADPLMTRKLEPKYHGPFRVVERTKGGSYRLENYHINERLPERFAPHQLKPISHDPLLEDSSDDDGDAPAKGTSYQVEKILAHREVKKGKYEYLVKWQGYSKKHNLWIPPQNFDGLTLINNYWRGQPSSKQ